MRFSASFRRNFNAGGVVALLDKQIQYARVISETRDANNEFPDGESRNSETGRTVFVLYLLLLFTLPLLPLKMNALLLLYSQVFRPV